MNETPFAASFVNNSEAGEHNLLELKENLGDKEGSGRTMTEAKDQKIYYALFVETTFASFEEAASKASDLIAAHVAQSKELHAEGKVLMAGAFLNTPNESLRTMAICPSREAAEEFMRRDPLNINGMVSNWYIREWANIFA